MTLRRRAITKKERLKHVVAHKVRIYPARFFRLLRMIRGNFRGAANRMLLLLIELAALITTCYHVHRVILSISHGNGGRTTLPTRVII